MPGTDFAAIAPLVDQFAVMNYDYAGPWSSITGFLAPLFPDSNAAHRSASIARSIDSYKAAGVPADKLLMGLPFYGYGWTEVSGANHGLFQDGHPIRGDQPYRFIRGLATPSSVFRDQLSKAPWIFDGQNFWTYDDPISIRYKVSYAARQRLGGIMIWELSGDTTDAELLHTAYRALHHPLKAKVFARAIAAQRQPAPSAASALHLGDDAVAGAASH
jgi:chitinase